MKKDHNTNRPFKRAVLRDRGGDLTKEWYVEFYAWNESTQRLIRKRIKIPLSLQSKASRVEEANKLIAETNELLEKGYHFKVEPLPTEEITNSIEIPSKQKKGLLAECRNELILALKTVLLLLTRVVSDQRRQVNLQVNGKIESIISQVW